MGILRVRDGKVARPLQAAAPPRKLAKSVRLWDQGTMRRLLTACLALTASACALAPQETAVTPAPVAPTAHNAVTLIGLSSSDLAARFGQPRLRVAAGTGTKLQWANSTCVLDAYLYPRGSGRDTFVTHVDARRPTGESFESNACARTLAR